MRDAAFFARSFAAGELTPELFSRIDLTANQTGLALCLNFIVLPHGPVTNRPGFEFVLESKFSERQSRLVPLVYSDTDTFVLELGDGYMRFHTNGTTLVEDALDITDISSARPGVVTVPGHPWGDGDEIFLSDIGASDSRLEGRFATISGVVGNTFRIYDQAGIPIDTSTYTYIAGGKASRVYEITTPYAVADLDLLEIDYAQSNAVLTFTHTLYPTRELVRTGPIAWTFGLLDIDPPLDPPILTTVLETGAIGADARPETYGVTAVTDQGVESFLSNTIACSNELWKAMNYNTLTWFAVVGAARYNVYKARGGLFSFIGQATGLTFVDDNITANTAQTPPEPSNPFDAADKYPATVTYYEQRRAFAGSLLKPTNTWLTRTGTDSNFTSSIPTRDDDSIAFRLAARESNAIRHIVPLDDLVLLTSSAAWRVVAKNSDALTPTSISVKPSYYVGASKMQPVIAGNIVLYGAARGGHLMALRYSWEANGHTVEDASILAPHLFDGFELIDQAWHIAPYKVNWCVRSDGVLLGMTSVPEHQVRGWHRHVTQGAFEACCTVVEGNEDVLYVIVRREVNSRTVRYIERMRSRQLATLSDAFFVDAGRTYTGAAATEITGLWHLEGCLLSILTDGAVHPQRQVVGGTIALDYPASVVHLGLSYNADLQTLPLGLPQAPDGGQSAQKNITTVWARVNQSSSIFAGPSFDQLSEFKQRTDEPYGSPPSLVSATIEIPVEPSWSADGQLCMRQSQPLPLTVQSIAPTGGISE